MRGRPPKPGPRYQNGARKTPTVLAEAVAKARAERREQQTVLDQPHRQGDASAKVESALGRFCIANKLSDELYRGGMEYANLVGKWRRTWGAPRDAGTPGDPEFRPGTNEGPTLASAQRWLEKIHRVEAAIRECEKKTGDNTITGAIRQLVILERPLDARIWSDAAAINGLAVVAVMMGTATSRRHPFK